MTDPHDPLEPLLRWAEIWPAVQAQLAERRAQLIKDVETEFAVTLHPGRRQSQVVVSASDYEWLLVALERYDPLARGYYTGLGGELDVIVAPDWTCDPARVAWLRLVVVTTRPIRRLVRWLAARWPNEPSVGSA